MPSQTAATRSESVLADFRVSFAPHPEHGPVDDYVLQQHGIIGELPDLTVRSLVDQVSEIIRVACVKAAAREVDYDKLMENEGENDSSYLDLCDKLGLDYRVTAIAFDGCGEAVRYACTGAPADSDVAWSGEVMAVDEEDAKFQAKWQMALAGSIPTTDYDGFAAAMDECEVETCALVEPDAPTTPRI